MSGDCWCFGSSCPCLCVGGGYGRNSGYGLFCVGCGGAAGAGGGVGCRFLFDISNLTDSWHRQPHTSW
nr:MAG TPA: hypothetical protein [Caudoviricetes sp.]